MSKSIARESGIIFSGEMVRAIQDSRKTQTRRVVRNPERLNGLMLAGEEAEWCPYGKPGDRLWVRETCRAEELGEDWRTYPQNIIDEYVDESNHAAGLDGVRYAADDYFRPIENSIAASEDWVTLNCYRGKRGAKVPSIHMPRWASRINLEVTGIRMERLRHISSADCVAEGLHGTMRNDQPVRERYRELWDSLNAKRAPWASNPWVWVITFKRLSQ